MGPCVRPRVSDAGLTLCASSKAMTRPMVVGCSKKRLRHMLNKAQAPSEVTHGHDRSTMVSDPGYIRFLDIHLQIGDGKVKP